MSVSGPNLGTLLIQRIDAALGTTLSQQTNLVNGARPDAISQAVEAAKLESLQNQVIREPRENVDRALLQNDQQLKQGIEKTKLDAQKGLLTTGRESASTGTTPSAPTTLGNAARTILSLLTSFPDQPSPVQGKRPLVSPSSEGGRSPTGQNTSTTQGVSSNAGAANTAAPSTAALQNTPVTAVGANQTQGSPAASGDVDGGPPSTTMTATAPGAQANTTSTAGTQTNAVMAMAMAAQKVSAQAFSQALGNAIQSSGLFYESHLADLAFGTMPAQAIKQEPQAQLPQPAVLRTMAASAGAEAAPLPNQAVASRTELAQTSNTNTASQMSTQTTTSTGNTATPSTQFSSTLANLHPETHLMVRQQLEVLANHTIAWRGEAWPEAKMDWEIQRREPDPDAGPESQTHWATRIKLHLPHLGEVDVRINLLDRKVLLHAVAPQSAQTLTENRELLHSSFDASGLVLSQFIVDAAANQEEKNDQRSV